MNTYQMNLGYGNWTVYISERSYSNGRLALAISDANDHEPVATATINIPEAKLEGNEIIIKDYAKNTGMLDFLQKNGIVGPVKRMVFTGFVRCPAVDYLGKH